MSTHNSTRSHYNYWPGIPPVVPLEAELTLRPYSVITTTATRLPHAIDQHIHKSPGDFSPGLVPTAEDRGFEPLRDCSQHAFQACDIGR